MINIINNLIFFYLGAIIGSFLNMLIDRLPKGEEIIFKRSHCDSCHKTLGILDLVPVFSFLLLKGKCRYCHIKIPFRNLFVEMLSGIGFIFVINFYNTSDIGQIIFQLIILCVLIAIFFIDLDEGIIPDSLILTLIVSTLLYQSLFNIIGVGNLIMSGVVFFLFFLFLVLITKGKGMGMGDVKISFFIGFYLGFNKMLIAFYLAFLTGAVFSLILIYKGRKNLKSTIPFGPFLVLATFISNYYGEIILGIAKNLLF